jgi:hypothetical protein
LLDLELVALVVDPYLFPYIVNEMIRVHTAKTLAYRVVGQRCTEDMLGRTNPRTAQAVSCQNLN